MNLKRKDFLLVTSSLAVSTFLPSILRAAENAVTGTDMTTIQLHPDDEKVFENIVARYVKTWNERDLDAWADLFSDDVDYINRGGGWWTTNKDNVAGHRALFKKNPNAPKTYKASIEKISMLRPDIALLHVRWVWPGITGTASENDFNGIMSWVLVKDKSKWRVRSVQNTVCV